MKYLFLIFALFFSSAFATEREGNSNSNIENSSRSSAAVFVGGQTNVQTVEVKPVVPVTVTSPAVNLRAGDVTFKQGDSTLGVSTALNVPKQAPDLTLGNVYPTSPCMGSSQVGGSGVGFSFGLGTSWTDHECGKRETARSFAAIGKAADALAILCSSEYATAAPSCKATPTPKEPK